jgi:hypothetical protein
MTVCTRNLKRFSAGKVSNFCINEGKVLELKRICFLAKDDVALSLDISGTRNGAVYILRVGLQFLENMREPYVTY